MQNDRAHQIRESIDEVSSSKSRSTRFSAKRPIANGDDFEDGLFFSPSANAKLPYRKRVTKEETRSNPEVTLKSHVDVIGSDDDEDDSNSLEIISVIIPDDQILPAPTSTTRATENRKRKPSSRTDSLSVRSVAAGTSPSKSQQFAESLMPATKLFECPSSSKSVSFTSKCLEGCIYLDRFYQHLIRFGTSSEVASEMTSMAVSSDFLIPTPCPLGRPHFVSLESGASNRPIEQFLLVGDALRLIILASTSNPTPEQRNAVNHISDLCGEMIRSILVENIGVSTQEGFQRVPPQWSSLLSSYSYRLPSLHWLPIITPPHDVISQVFDAVASTSICSQSTTVASWTSGCPVDDLAHRAISFCSKVAILDPVNPSPLISIANSTGEVTSAQTLREFLSVSPTSPTSSSTSSKSPLDILIHMTPPQLHDLYQLFGCNHTTGFAGLGLICLLFKRLFMHLFVNASVIGRGKTMVLRHILRLVECPEEETLYHCDVFTHLAKIHTCVSACLKSLRTSYPQVVSAGACLTAKHRLMHHPDDVTDADIGRSRLFTTAEEARDVIVRVFKDDVCPFLVTLLEAVATADKFISLVLARDLYMFRRLRGRDCRVDESNAFHLLRSGIEILKRFENKNIFQKVNQPGKMMEFEKLLEPVMLCEAKLAILRPPGVLYLVEQVTIQLKAFRQSLLTSRQHLSSWWVAFTDSAVDVGADSNVKLFVAAMQSIYDTIESWTRGVHNVGLRVLPGKMLNIIVQDIGKQIPGLHDLKVAPSESELVGVPYGSKNSATTGSVLSAVAVASLPLYPQNIPPVDAQSTVSSETSMSLDLLKKAFPSSDDDEKKAKSDAVEEKVQKLSLGQEGINKINDDKQKVKIAVFNLVPMKVEEEEKECQVVQRIPSKKVTISVGADDIKTQTTEVEQVQGIGGEVFTSNFSTLDRRTLGKLKRNHKILFHQQ